MKRLFAILALALSLSACDEFKDLAEAPAPMGDFLLGHNIVVAPDPEIGPLSRKADEEEWKASMNAAIAERFGRYDGDHYYHIAVKVEGYVLAFPGVPFVASPKSVLILGVTLWDDAEGTKINAEPKRFVAFERLSEKTFLSSGLFQNKETQMSNLSRSAAKMIHDWMLEHPEWFGGEPLETEETEATEPRKDWSKSN
ncbi:hypothetical protein [Aliiroseovarius subalbicans]|uniref:hypothetical protein n=1 Tax=Aliiroseovarius subalbicans TaxID=2925840 RepID=UPI001F57C66A|nr:hypothetical protein [Aliiroseovarius subalbicans]MCI2399692.1 hypothetical protein [Aliiroseovarius subalbicans]